jgi:hypothetical protein
MEGNLQATAPAGEYCRTLPTAPDASPLQNDTDFPVLGS